MRWKRCRWKMSIVVLHLLYVCVSSRYQDHLYQISKRMINHGPFFGPHLINLRQSLKDNLQISIISYIYQWVDQQLVSFFHSFYFCVFICVSLYFWACSKQEKEYPDIHFIFMRSETIQFRKKVDVNNAIHRHDASLWANFYCPRILFYFFFFYFIWCMNVAHINLIILLNFFLISLSEFSSEFHNDVNVATVTRKYFAIDCKHIIKSKFELNNRNCGFQM